MTLQLRLQANLQQEVGKKEKILKECLSTYSALLDRA
jgi:hypothetical protein